MSEDLEIQKIVGQIAAAYFANSHVTPNEIPTVIGQIASSLAAVGAPQAAPATAEAEPEPEQPKLTSSQIRRSITRDAIISFEDNKPYKTMRRHLAARGLTPEEYRSKWGLPVDYPMVAPVYSEARAAMARANGLGGRVRPGASAAATPQTATPAAQTSATEAQPAANAAEPQPQAEARRPPRNRARAAAAQAAPAPSVQEGEGAAPDGKAPRRRAQAGARATRKPGRKPRTAE